MTISRTLSMVPAGTVISSQACIISYLLACIISRTIWKVKPRPGTI